MSISEIKQLSLNEKLRVMEMLWEELRTTTDSISVPEWQKELLDARRVSVKSGKEKVLDWDAVKGELGQTVK